MKSVNENSNGDCVKIDSNWTTRDKLYLVSSVLMNGDQDLSFISRQLSQAQSDFELKQTNGTENFKYSLSVSYKNHLISK